MSSDHSNQRRCAACRHLRRRCSEDCILSPYFPASDPHRFASVHRIFGASNVARMLQQVAVHERREAAESISREAYWRAQDPVYGSVGIISMLHHEINMAQRELARTQAHIAIYTSRQNYSLPQPPPPPPPLQQQQQNLTPDTTFLDLQHHLPDLF
ncbi:hypothetical protein J5N97_003492 [Dioscorea zingiberensis]|uniref:LOB domain-containing protein n=1 Tax=Dioscorea zingiberensis TaxID=325984 RepID=A0A9D5D4S0_9LILI|nr:hypothetical protein J5N97_003492 [Dioscorea zingiberensis]